MEGQTLDGKYTIVRLLGKGGMGFVYEATEQGTDRRVAVKVMSGDDVVKNKVLLSRFHREARATIAIDTPHIVQALDTGSDDSGAPFLVMELLEGEDLSQLLERTGPLPADIVMRIGAQVCAGLVEAHKANVVHRDIKPANLFLARRPGGEILVKILDFGIAKIKMDQAMAADTTGITRTGSMLGSPLYMSPEQARGIKTIDHRTDLWSLGIVLYKALAGRTPHQDIDALGDLIIAICSEPPHPLQEHAPWVKPDVARVVHEALRFELAERYPTAQAMLEAIRTLLPDGASLRESMLEPVSDAERSTQAPRLDLGPAGSRSVVRVSGEPSSVTAPTVDVSTHRGVTSVSTASIRPSSRRNTAFVAAAAIGAAAVGAYALFGRSQTAVPRADDVAAAESARVAISAPAPPATTASAAPVATTVRLAISPPDAVVDLDGASVANGGGFVDVSGLLGSVHKVHLKKGRDEVTGEVSITAEGARPVKVELASAAGQAATAPKTARPAAAPPSKATATPASPAPGIKENFE